MLEVNFFKESASEANSLYNKVLAFQRQVMKARVNEEVEKYCVYSCVG